MSAIKRFFHCAHHDVVWYGFNTPRIGGGVCSGAPTGDCLRHHHAHLYRDPASGFPALLSASSAPNGTGLVDADMDSAEGGPPGPPSGESISA